MPHSIVTVQSGGNIQQAIDTSDVVKLAPGAHLVTPTSQGYCLHITHSVRLEAADPDHKPLLICTSTEENTRVFLVDAPRESVSMENLKIYSGRVGKGGSSIVLKCGDFEIRGCEPVAPGDHAAVAARKFGLLVGYLPDTPLGTLSQISKFTAKENIFEVPSDNHCFETYRYDANGADFVFSKNRFTGGVGAILLNYRSLDAKDNDFTCSGYVANFVGSGLSIGSRLADSRATLEGNRIHMNAPDPYLRPHGPAVPGVRTFGIPLQLGNIVYDMPAFNVDIKNIVIDSKNSSADGKCSVPSAVLLWKADNCSVKNPDYSAIVIDASGPCPAGGGDCPEYDYGALGSFMRWVGDSTCGGNPAPPCWSYYAAAYSGEIQALAKQQAAEYLLAYSTDTKLIDHGDPRIAEFQTKDTVLHRK
jgi:hypothetical protein